MKNRILDYYQQKVIADSNNLQSTFAEAFNDISSGVNCVVLHPAGIRGNLNSLSNEDKTRISTMSSNDCEIAAITQSEELKKDFTAAINLWRKILGNDFPSSV